MTKQLKNLSKPELIKRYRALKANHSRTMNNYMDLKSTIFIVKGQLKRIVDSIKYHKRSVKALRKIELEEQK